MANTKAVGVAFADPLLESAQFAAYTVAQLPAASIALRGTRAMVTDANATLTAGIGANVAAGGANVVPVFCDGTNWVIG
jgi:hypothetical protein